MSFLWWICMPKIIFPELALCLIEIIDYEIYSGEIPTITLSANAFYHEKFTF